MNKSSGFFNVTLGVPLNNQKLPVLAKKPTAMLIRRDWKQSGGVTARVL